MQLIHHPRAHLHQTVSNHSSLPHVPILLARYPDLRKVILFHSQGGLNCDEAQPSTDSEREADGKDSVVIIHMEMRRGHLESAPKI